MMKPHWATLAVATFALLAASLRGESVQVKDPSGNLRFTLDVAGGRAVYQVEHRGHDGSWITVVEASPLGFTRADAQFETGVSLVRKEAVQTVTDNYTLVTGKRSRIDVNYVLQTFHLTNAQNVPFTITVRAQADGVAFRYGFPAAASEEHRVVNETTGFKIPTPGKVWLQPYERVAVWSPAYEMEYQNGIPIGTPTPEGSYAGWALPALFETHGRWLLVTEAHLDGSSFAVHLQPECEGGLYRVRLPENDETYGVAPQYAVTRGAWQSPWRAFIVGETLATVVESTFVYDLNPPSKIADTSWITPGLASWSWWSDMSSASDYHRLVPWIDIAAQLKWPLSTIDLGWHQMKNGTIDTLLDYAKSKNVGLVLWYNSGGKHNQVPDAGPMDRLDTPERCEKEMAWLASKGVRGVKVDFFQSDKQYVVQKYLDILQAAARHKIMVDFHGATIPRGWARTYPNLMTSEGVRGAEQYWDPNFAEKVHTLSTIYTFTRNVIGSMDFTPVVIGGAPHLQWHKTTHAFELATAVAFESGWQHICASPAALHVQPASVLDFLTDLPATWDETKYVAGYPGELSVLARRKGTTWYVAALNGRSEAQTTSFGLGFLGAGQFSFDQISDGKSQKEIVHTQGKAVATDQVTLNLSGRGGAVLRLRALP